MPAARKRTSPRKAASKKPPPEELEFLGPPDALAAVSASQPAFATIEAIQTHGLEPETAAAALADAKAVHDQIAAQPWIVQDSLVRWAVQTWGDRAVDRLNAATGLLERMGRIVRMG